MFSGTVLIRQNLKSFKKILVSGITLEFDSWSRRYGLIIILLIVGSHFMILELVLVARGSIKRYLWDFMFWIGTLLQLYWSRRLKLLFIGCMVHEFGWGLEAVIGNLISASNEGILFWVVIRLQRKWLIVFSI